jgi:hypothetical protein
VAYSERHNPKSRRTRRADTYISRLPRRPHASASPAGAGMHRQPRRRRSRPRRPRPWCTHLVRRAPVADTLHSCMLNDDLGVAAQHTHADLLPHLPHEGVARLLL